MENYDISKVELRASFLSELNALKRNRKEDRGFLPISIVLKLCMDEAEEPNEKIAVVSE